MFRTVASSIAGVVLSLGLAVPAAHADLRVIPFTSGSGSIYSANYACTAANLGPGVVKGCPDLIVSGKVTLTAHPPADPPGHWRFVRWQGGGCGTSPICTIDEADGPASPWAIFDDPVPPTITPTVTQSLTRERTVTLGWTADEQASVTCAVDGATLPCHQPVVLPEGAHTFTARGQDNWGNVAEPVHKAFRILDTELLSGPAAVSNARPAVFRVSTRLGTRFDCTLDNRFLPGCAVPGPDGSGTVTLPDVADGQHTLRVYALDGEDFDYTPITRTWTVDTVAPTVTLGAGEPFTFSSNEPTAHFECQVDGGVFAPCLSGLKVDAGPGEHRFTVRAVDRAGNVGAAATRTWTVAAPEVVPQPAPKSAAIATLAGRRKVTRQRTVVLATVTCPSVCSVTAPKTVKLKIAGKRYTAKVTRTATRVGLELPKAAYTKLKGRTARVTLTVAATATGAPTTTLTIIAKIGR